MHCVAARGGDRMVAPHVALNDSMMCSFAVARERGCRAARVDVAALQGVARARGDKIFDAGLTITAALRQEQDVSCAI